VCKIKLLPVINSIVLCCSVVRLMIVRVTYQYTYTLISYFFYILFHLRIPTTITYTDVKIMIFLRGMIITIILLCSGLVRGGIHNVTLYTVRFMRTRQPANGLESEVWQRCSRYNNNRASLSGGAPRSPPKNHAGHNIIIIILFFLLCNGLLLYCLEESHPTTTGSPRE